MRKYVLISPCRDEQAYIRQTIDSVIAQSVKPSKWVIVDDGSTDDTPKILAEYASNHDWIYIVTLGNRGRRLLGSGVMNAFYAGYETLDLDDYEFICKLDLDVRLPPRYFELLISRMDADPCIATCSGKAYVERKGRLVFEGHADDGSLGMTKFYRATAFNVCGGFVRQIFWDAIDNHRCRMNGWIACSWDEPDLRFVHLRPMGSSHKGILTGRARHGYGQYYMGESFVWVVASAISRVGEKPYLIGSAAVLWGWFSSLARRVPRYEDPEFRGFLRRYHRRALIVGKRRALQEL